MTTRAKSTAGDSVAGDVAEPVGLSEVEAPSEVDERGAMSAATEVAAKQTAKTIREQTEAILKAGAFETVALRKSVVGGRATYENSRDPKSPGVMSVWINGARIDVPVTDPPTRVEIPVAVARILAKAGLL